MLMVPVTKTAKYSAFIMILTTNRKPQRTCLVLSRRKPEWQGLSSSLVDRRPPIRIVVTAAHSSRMTLAINDTIFIRKLKVAKVQGHAYVFKSPSQAAAIRQNHTMIKHVCTHESSLELRYSSRLCTSLSLCST